MSGYDRDLPSKLMALRAMVAGLVVVVGVQWVCQLLTAIVMFGWMGMALGRGPTSRAIDAFVYGFACVGFTALLAIAVGILGARSLVWTRGPSGKE